MSTFPAMPLFVDAYLADTTHLTAEEHGAYLLLLMAMWRRNGWVPDADKDLSRMCCVSPQRWPRVKRRLLPFLIVRDGELSQKRLGFMFDRCAELKRKNGNQFGGAILAKSMGSAPTRARAQTKTIKKKKKEKESDLFNGSAAPASPVMEDRSQAPAKPEETLTDADIAAINARLSFAH